MVKLDVQIEAQLENVTDLVLPENTRWYFIVEMEGEQKEIYLIPCEKMEIPNSRGECCFVMHSKETKKSGTISFIKSKKYDVNGKMKTIGTFECRGVDLVKFLPRSGFEVSSTKSDTTWDDVDLTEGDWAEYDEEANESVVISEVKTNIVRSTGK
mmetsp:Transcript_28034/g.50507  ORF Transcript_28034/g.50507 Transcript_28034/m.50507 type:complete len:155 (-) Transcript_28034:554-1018(-)